VELELFLYLRQVVARGLLHEAAPEDSFLPKDCTVVSNSNGRPLVTE
jgi:hypothetical protein